MNILDEQPTTPEFVAAFALLVFPVYLVTVGLNSLELFASATLVSMIVGITTVFTVKIRRSVPHAERALTGWQGAFRLLYAPASIIGICALLWHHAVSSGAEHWLIVLLAATSMAHPGAVVMASRRVAVGAKVVTLIPWAITWSIALFAAVGKIRPLLAVATELAAVGLSPVVWRKAVPELLMAPRQSSV